MGDLDASGILRKLSRRGQDLGWQINNGPDKVADYVTAGQLRNHLYRPDIVTKAIQLASAEEAIRSSYGTDFKLEDLLALPCRIFVLCRPRQKALWR